MKKMLQKFLAKKKMNIAKLPGYVLPKKAGPWRTILVSG